MQIFEKKTVVYSVAVISSILWGLTFLGSKVALEELNTIQVLAGRWTLSMFIFIALVICKVIKVNYRGKPLWKLAAVAFIQPCLYAICEIWGLDLTSTSEASIMCAMVPVVVALLSAAVLRNKVRPIVVGGILLSFAGVIVTVVFTGNFSVGGRLEGYLLLIGMVLFGALFTLGSSKISKDFSPMEITFAQAVFGGVWFNALTLAQGRGFSWYSICFTSPKIGLAILFLGVIGSTLCYVVFHLVVSKIPAPQASMLQVNLITLAGVVSGIVVLGDPFGWYTAVGLVMVLAGVVMANRVEC